MISSMFHKLLPNNIDVYAVSATLPDQDGWQAFCHEKIFQTCHGKSPKLVKGDIIFDHIMNDRVNTIDVPLYMARIAIDEAKDTNERHSLNDKLQILLNGRQYVDKHMSEYVNSIQHLLTVDSNAILNTKQELNNRQCYQNLVDRFHQKCFNLNQNPYVLGKLYIFVNICEEMRESSDADINAVNQLLIQVAVKHTYEKN
ncbi:unnamed protein product [Medioppia subpectinata]|uniref:Legumain prodomain domain-containing protein n=1 Tax=Medioppia subpectinata TaxID=1979941 RepID=A0A7R9PVN2_9ACAR|nr:unnamed protein product [Medioppia subpectinata]CAG2103022.1 unnamed protein product [Medioppia subpectinata]